MKVIVEDSAKNNILNIFSYNSTYSIKNAIETNMDIQAYINDLAESSYIGRYVPEIKDKHFREIIYRKTRHSIYRIIYYISETSKTIYVLNVLNNKKDFNQFLKLNNYFKNFFRI